MYHSNIGYIESYNDEYNSRAGMSQILAEETKLKKQKEQNKIMQENSVYDSKNYGALFELQKNNGIFKLTQESTKKCTEKAFCDLLLEMYMNSLPLDKSFIEENYNAIRNYFVIKLDEFADYNLYDLMEKCSKNNNSLNKVVKSCKNKAKKKVSKAEEKAKNAKTLDEIDTIFDEISKEENEFDPNEIDLDPEKVSDKVKDTVITVVKEEEENSEKKKRFIDDLNSSKEMNESNYLYKNDFIEHHSLFNSIMIGEYKNCLKTIKEAGKDYNGKYGTINENNEIKINMDYVLADTILEYTRLELLSIMGLLNKTPKEIQEMADHYAYFNK